MRSSILKYFFNHTDRSLSIRFNSISRYPVSFEFIYFSSTFLYYYTNNIAIFYHNFKTVQYWLSLTKNAIGYDPGSVFLYYLLYCPCFARSRCCTVPAIPFSYRKIPVLRILAFIALSAFFRSNEVSAFPRYIAPTPLSLRL